MGRLRARLGFSLVELMIVVAIIGVLATIGVPTFRTMVQKAKKSEAKVALGGLYTSETAFFSEYGVYGNATDKLGFELDGVGTQRAYNIGFFNGNCQAFTATIAPAIGTAGASLNISFPGYFASTKFGEPGKAFPVANVTGDAACAKATIDPATSLTFTAGAAGMISQSSGATPDVWTINQQRQLANQVDGVK